MNQARGLVLVRLGRDHRVEPLLTLPRTARSWDIALSFYDDSVAGPGTIVEWSHRHPGGKWDGIWQFFAEHEEALSGYDYYWLVDDDIESDAQAVEGLFSYVRNHGFQLAQPALTHDSFYSHRLTLASPGFLHRHTNLVEIMAPMVSATLLTKLLPLLQNTRSGFGLDWYWQTLVPEPARRIAIIDCLAVRHARPLRQHLRGAMRREGRTPEQERERLVESHGIKRLHAVATSGLTCDGQRIETRVHMALHMAWNYWRVRKQVVQRRWGLKESAMLLYRQLFAPLGYRIKQKRSAK
jgi:hypothetical protein